MAKKKLNKQTRKSERRRDSVFTEAWENMNDDLSRVMPNFIASKLQGGKNKLWVMIIVTVVELVILGVLGKLLYDWFTG